MIKIKKKCIICNKSYETIVSYKSKIKTARKTCSDDCRYIIISHSQSKPKKDHQCKHCNKIFSDEPSRNRIFCSVKCKAKWQSKNLLGKNNPNWKPYNPLRSADRTIRRHILIKRQSCEKCNTYQNLQIHHIDQNRANNSPENLLLLCQYCHANEHRRIGDNCSVRLIMNHPQSKGRKTHHPKPCKQCKNQFHPYRSSLKFCSVACAIKYRFNTPHKGRICPFCKRTYAYKRRKQKYCSSSCRYSAISG
jgi:hypothetical protein